MIIPAVDSDTEKSVAMSVRRPMGMNSLMLKMNTQIVIPMSGSHCLGDIVDREIRCEDKCFRVTC